MSSMDMIRHEKALILDQPAKVVTVLSQSGSPDIKQFDVKALNDQMERTLSALHPDETVAAVGWIDTEGAKLAVVGRIRKVPGDFRWTVLHEESWHNGRSTAVGFRWGF